MATLVGSGGFTWFTSSSSVTTLASGYSSTYDSGLRLYHNLPGFETSFSSSTETTEDLGREIVYGPQVSNEVSVTRKQYVPTDQPFARFLEIFTNNGAVSKTFTVEIRSDIYSDSETIVTATSSGDALVSATDKWIVVDDNGPPGYVIPAAAHVFAGTGAPVQPSSVTVVSEDDMRYQYSLTLAPGQTKIIMHFASLAADAATAAANAAALAALPSYALSGLSVAELTSVVNFNAGFIFSGVTYTLASGQQNLQLTGAAHINGTGNALNNTIVGNTGNNVLNGGAGNDTLNGGNGTDTASYAGTAAGVTVNLALAAAQNTVNAGNDTLISIENLSGSSFADRLTGNSGNNVLDGGAGTDTMIGGLGNDTYVVNSVADVVTEASNAGTDLVQSTAAHTLAVNVENLTLLGTGHINGTGNSGNNVLAGNSGNNSLNGGTGTGTDTASYAGAAAAVTVNLGTTAQNTIGAGTDTLTAIENLTGSAFADRLTGNTGNNVLDGGAGVDTMIGGSGNDTYVVNSTQDMVTEVSNGGTDLVQSAATAHTLAVNVENLALLGSAHINGTGNTGNNVLTGNSGNNVLNGGNGTDTASYANAAAAVTVNLALAAAQNTVGAGSDTLTSIENLTGSAFNDTLSGNSGSNVLNGGGGIDTASYAGATAGVTVSLALTGAQNTVHAGNDTLASIENLTGSGFNDRLTGNSSNNVLNGGIGTDTMIGGAGNDTYLVNSSLDVATEGSNAGTDLVQSTATYTLPVNVENLTLLGTANINGTGNASNNIIIGNSGNNVLNGGGGNDTLLGQDGNDRFILSAGNDVISGGAGDDTIVVDEGFGTVEIRDTLGIEYIDFSAVNGAITVDLTPGSENHVAGGTLRIFQGGAVSEPLDLVFLQDLSGSFSDDIASVRGLVPNIANAVQAFQPDTRFGVTSHVDKATGGFGSGNDYVYRTDMPLTASQSQLQATYNGLSILGGGDLPESQIEALMQIALRNAEVGWRGNALKVVLVMTDADYHRAGDAALPANDGDTVLEGTPPGTGEDYPSVELLRQKLVAANILPIFAVTSDFVATYQGLTTQLGFGEVVSLSSNSADIVTAIQTGLNKATAAKIDRILGTAFADSITGSEYDNFIDGGAGADTMAGGLGDDTYVVGVAGDSVVETAVLNSGTDTVQTALNNYVLGANVENLTLLGAANINGTGNGLNNVLTGNTVNNTLNGSAGNDTLNGGGGADTMIGGTGNDTYVVNVATDVVTEGSNAGTDLVQSTVAGYTLSVNVENLTLTGTAAINGTGNTGNNVLMGNSGNNVLHGGTGNDTASYANAAAGVTVSLAIAGAQNTVGAGSDTLISIENLTGSRYNDTLTGNTGNNVLEGGAGNDTLNGGDGTDTASYAGVSAGVSVDLASASQFNSAAGNDTLTGIENLIGGSFNDTLTGSSASNALYGSDGNDTLNGDLGNDTLTGGAGTDLFLFDSALGAGNIDTISGFSVADDTIRLDNAIFTSFLQSFVTLAAGSFRTGAGITTGADADDFVIYNTTNGQLYYDAGGNTGAATQHFATLSGVVGAVTAADFFIV